MLQPIYKPVSKLASQAFFPSSRNQTGLFKQSSRLQNFTEEFCRWEFSTREEVFKHGPSQFCVSGEDAFHLLSTSPQLFGITTCVPDGNRETKRFLDLSETLPLDKNTQMFATANNSSKLALFLPSYDALFYVNPTGGTAKILRLSQSGTFGKPFLSSDAIMHQSEVAGKFYFCGQGFVRILDEDELTTIPLPISVASNKIRPIGPDEFLVELGPLRRGHISNSEGEWLWQELETSDKQLLPSSSLSMAGGNKWSLHHHLGVSSQSFLQSLDFSAPSRIQIMHSPRTEASSNDALVAFSPQVVCSASPTHLEVVTVANPESHMRRIPIANPVCQLSIFNDHVYTVTMLPQDQVARVSKYEVNADKLRGDLLEWRKMWGLPLDATAVNEQLRTSQQLAASKPPPEASTPKHGKVDNKPHVGGNTWAGGTGGSDTAGLGGRGGPYRLDKGDPVHQLSDQDKQNVDQSVLDKARALNRLAFEERLREIGMNPNAYASYMNAKHRVQIDLDRLRAIFELSNLQRKERVWERHQSFGELDDAKLVDGICGERQIYKRRVLKPPSPGSPNSSAPLNVKVVVDVSASMYRFQSMDGRLQRMVDTVLMLLESLRGMESRFRLSVAGHSGESEAVEFVPWDRVPKDEAKVWQVLEEMMSHSQYCMSGDTTVEAIKSAVQDVLKQDEEHGGLVIVVSDANLRRYGIAPSELAKEMKSAKVKTHVVFIASVRDEAEVWARELPLGRAKVCLETSDLPHIMRDILLDSATE
ncbi:hypothetical protein BASA81_011099 [Batrachochytrium salamandrivorans]|nr:hypothetical protein BASA81_011099 [Batrachochytrium salamandrivorans]